MSTASAPRPHSPILARRLPGPFEARRRREQLAGVTLPAFGFGFVVGVALGLSSTAYVVLLVVAGLGGIAAGLEHRRPARAALRGLCGGAIFGVAVLVGHWVLGRDATVALPSPEAVEVLITAAGSVPLALIGVALRRHLEPRVTAGRLRAPRTPGGT